jgi:glycosyltransferase involved in cell wall biosynthesis
MKVAWFTYFPVEWLDDLPPELHSLPRMHPATWQRVLLAELQKEPSLQLDIVILRKQFPRSLSFRQGNATFHCVKAPGGLRAPGLFWIDTWLVGRVLRRARPDLVHAWGSENGAALIASRLPYPSLVTLQGLMTWMVELGIANGYQKFAARLERTSLRRLRHATCESSFALRYLRDRYPGLAIRQIEHAPNWGFHHVERRPATSPRRLLSISTLGHAKGTDVLLGALDAVRQEFDFELVLVGGAPAEVLADYQRRFSPELWSRIRFKNHLTSTEVAAELASASLMVYPSRADNSPNAVKECVAAGVPVVASEIGGIVDYVIPGENGFLFPAGDVAACTRAIRDALNHPLMGRGAVAPATLARMRDYLSPATMGRKFLEAYRAVVSEAGRAQ